MDDERVTDVKAEIPAAPGGTALLRAGKRRFARVRFV